MTNIDYDAQDEYLAGYVRGRDDSKGRHPLYFTANSTAPHYICGYDDGYNGVPPQQFMKEGTTEDTQDTAFEAVTELVKTMGDDDLSRVAYWALDAIQHKENASRYTHYLIDSAKLAIEYLQEELDNKD